MFSIPVKLNGQVVIIYKFNIKDIKESASTPNCIFSQDSGELTSRLAVDSTRYKPLEG